MFPLSNHFKCAGSTIECTVEAHIVDTYSTYVYLPLILPVATTVNFQKCCSPATYITQSAASECVPVYEEPVQSYCCACRVAPCTYFKPHQLPELSVHFGLTEPNVGEANWGKVASVRSSSR